MYVCAVTGPFPSGRGILRNIQHGLVIVNKARVTLAAWFDFRREYPDNEDGAGEKAFHNCEAVLQRKG